MVAFFHEGTSRNTARTSKTALQYWGAWHALRYGVAIAAPVSPAVVIQFIVDHLEHLPASQAPGNSPYTPSSQTTRTRLAITYQERRMGQARASDDCGHVGLYDSAVCEGSAAARLGVRSATGRKSRGHHSRASQRRASPGRATHRMGESVKVYAHAIESGSPERSVSMTLEQLGS